MAIGQGFELATNPQFNEVGNFTKPPRAGVVTEVIAATGQVRVDTDDPDGGDVLAWPLNGFIYAVNDVVYVMFASNSPDSGIVLGSVAPLPVLDADVLPEPYVPVDGTDPLTGDWDIGEDRRIKAEALRARDGEGLKLEDDAGNVGLQVNDGGDVQIENDLIISPGGTQNYVLSDDGATALTLQSKSAGQSFDLRLFTEDADGTDGIQISVWAEGKTGATGNRSRMRFIYDAASGEFRLDSEANGTGTLRPIKIFTEGNTDQLNIATNGRNGMGVATPQGKLHIHDGTGGLIFVTKTGIVASAQTIIPDGTGDVARGITGFIVLYDGSATIANSITMLPGDDVDIAIGSATFRLSLSVAGALTVIRTAGSATGTLALLGVWL